MRWATRCWRRRWDGRRHEMSEKKKAAKAAKMREQRSAAGKKGMAARWGEHGETVTVRAYKPDAERLREMAPTTAEAIRRLLEEAEG